MKSCSIDSGGRTGRFFPHVQGGDGGGGRSKSKEGALNLVESLAAEDGRLRLDSLVACLLRDSEVGGSRPLEGNLLRLLKPPQNFNISKIIGR